MKIEDIEYFSQEGYSLMRATIDGEKTIIGTEQKRTLIQNGIVCTGLEDSFSVEFQGRVFRGCTDDPAVYKAVMAFGNAVRTGTFKPGRVS
jgi:hypothetical protein